MCPPHSFIVKMTVTASHAGASTIAPRGVALDDVMLGFSSNIPLPHVPEDLTLEQFILSGSTTGRPVRPKSVPWLVSDKTGQNVDLAEVGLP